MSHKKDLIERFEQHVAQLDKMDINKHETRDLFFKLFDDDIDIINYFYITVKPRMDLYNVLLDKYSKYMIYYSCRVDYNGFGYYAQQRAAYGKIMQRLKPDDEAFGTKKYLITYREY